MNKPRPLFLREHIIAALARAPGGLTTRQVCELVEGRFCSIASQLSKLADYGLIERELVHDRGRNPQPIYAIWRAPAVACK